MPTRLRVLLVEDVPEDSELLLRQLRASGYEPEYRRVDTEAEWDIVISDYKMPHFSAPDALRAVQELVRDVPFIVVSGTVAEDVAVECMRAGAADFVAKNRLVRLGPAVARELQESAGRRARRRAESALRRSEASARKIVAASGEGIVIVDRAGLVRYVNPAAGTMLGQPAAALLGAAPPFSLSEQPGALEVELLPASGEPVTVELRHSSIDWAGEDSVVVFLHDITLRKLAERQLKDSFVSLADTLSRAMASRDPYTTDHQQRVADLVVLAGSRLGLDGERLWQLRLGGLLHDVGKVAVPESLLTKPGGLTAEEFDIVRTHAREGYEILKASGLPPAVALMALHHHENLDGTGYPDGLRGDALSLEARILTACNALESLTSFRPYRRAFSPQSALSRLVGGSGTKYDPAVVDCLNGLVAAGEYVPGRR